MKNISKWCAVFLHLTTSSLLLLALCIYLSESEKRWEMISVLSAGLIREVSEFIRAIRNLKKQEVQGD